VAGSAGGSPAALARYDPTAGSVAANRAGCSSRRVTRRRATVVLLVVLAWCAVSPWLSLGRAPASGAVIAANEQLDQPPALLSRAAVADHLARLSRSDLGTALPVDQRPQRAIQAAGAAAARRPPAPSHLHHRCALARRGSRAPDEPA